LTLPNKSLFVLANIDEHIANANITTLAFVWHHTRAVQNILLLHLFADLFNKTRR